MTAFDDVEREMLQDGVVLTAHTAWNFLLRLNLAFRNDLPVIVEANVMRESQIWQDRARAVRDWLSAMLSSHGLDAGQIDERLGVAHRLAPNRETQAGLAFEDGLAFLISKFCDVTPLVRRDFHAVPEHAMLRKGEADQIDLMVTHEGKLLAAVSCVWTTRRDRVGADVYDSVLFKERRPEVPFVIATNEYHPAVLRPMYKSRYVDAVYHVSKPGLLTAWRFGLAPTATLDQVARSRTLSDRLRTTMELDSNLVAIEQLFDDLRQVISAAS